MICRIWYSEGPMGGRPCRWCRADHEFGPGGARVNGRPAHLACERAALQRHVTYYRFFLALSLLHIAGVTCIFVGEFFSGHLKHFKDVEWAMPMFFSSLWLPSFVGRTVSDWKAVPEQIRQSGTFRSAAILKSALYHADAPGWALPVHEHAVRVPKQRVPGSRRLASRNHPNDSKQQQRQRDKNLRSASPPVTRPTERFAR